jgi:hypothetical protein
MNYKAQMLETKGNEFQVTFTKKDGSERTMSGKIEENYHEHSSGDEKYVVMFDNVEQDYRSVNVNTVKSFKMI